MILRHVAGPDTAAPNSGRRDRGETLVEVLVMIVLLGVGFTAIFTGLMTVSRINALNYRRTQASNGVQAWAEGIQQPARALTGQASDPYTYQPCASPDTYNTFGQPSGWMTQDWKNKNTKPVSVEYFDGTFTAAGAPNFNSDQNACWNYYFSPTGGNARDRGLQRITIKVETPTGVKPQVSDTLVILKRDQRCPALKNTTPNPDGNDIRFDNPDLGPC